MHKILTALCFVLLVGIVTSPVQADEKTTYTITVTGEGSTPAVPDQINITATVEAESPTSQEEALRDQGAKAKQVLDFLRKKGVPEKDIITQSFQIGPHYEYDRQAQKNELLGYRVTQSLKICVPRASAASVIDGIAKHASVNNVAFVVSNEDKLKEVAVDAAIADAKAKAVRRASALGVQLGYILGFQEAESYQMERFSYDGAGAKAAASASLPTGEVEISSKVSVTYELVVPKK